MTFGNASRFPAFLFVLIAAWPPASDVAAASRNRNAPPGTHRLLILDPPVPAAWLIPTPGSGARLHFLARDGVLYALHG
ncbi:MAG: hypothetical protein V3V56_00720, partial [bacterium]